MELCETFLAFLKVAKMAKKWLEIQKMALKVLGVPKIIAVYLLALS